MRNVIFLFSCVFWTLFLKAQDTSCVTAVSQVQQDSLVRFVNILTGRKSFDLNGETRFIESRYATHPGNNLAADYLKQTVTGYGFEVQDIPFSASGRNIVAFKNGTVNSKQAYLLCAHYDCVGNSTMAFQGADDNASGSAAILEAARVLRSVSFPYTIILAFWDEEEIGLLGSKAFAPDGPIGFWDVKATINLDMIGYDGNKDSLALIHTFSVGQSVALAARLAELSNVYQVGLRTRIKNPGDKSTDHNSFWNVGATAVGLTEDYDADFNPHWHLWSDSIENMHLLYFAEMSKLAIAAICDMGRSGVITGITPSQNLRDFFVYPNPVSDQLHIVSLQPLMGTLTIYNVLGIIVCSYPIHSKEYTLNTELFSPGYYTLEIRTAEGHFVRSFLK